MCGGDAGFVSRNQRSGMPPVVIEDLLRAGRNGMPGATLSGRGSAPLPSEIEGVNGKEPVELKWVEERGGVVS